MAVEITSLKWAWKLVTWLPGLFLKKVFPINWFQKQVLIDLRPRHDSVSLWAGDKKEISLWLNVINLTYFDLEIDRLIVEFHSAGHQVTLTKLDRNQVLAIAKKDFHLRANLSLDHVEAIKRSFESSKTAWIEVHAEINSKVHNFQLNLHLDGILPNYYNFPLN